MSKYLNIPNGDYNIKTKDGGRILLDTGLDRGSVEITGDLIVQGETTTVNTANLAIEDNIIVLNANEQGAGITLDEAGLKIDRGSLDAVFLLFDEAIGEFVLKYNASTLVGLRTNRISTGGGNLTLIGSGTGVISVAGTNNYEESVELDDHIPNKKYVDDAIFNNSQIVNSPIIGDGAFPSQSSVEVKDEENNTGEPSVINFSIDGDVVSQLYVDRWELHDIKIEGNTIETITTGNDLVLQGAGTGSVRIDDSLHINGSSIALEPSTGAELYVLDQSTGNTGIYFVNQNGNRDELVSKNRALLFSMLF